MIESASAALGLEGRISNSVVRFTEAELVDGINAFVQMRGSAAIDAWVDIRSNTIRLDTRDVKTAASIVAALEESTGIGDRFSIRAVDVAEPATPARGGRATTSCTTGFNWNWNSGGARISVAGHCGSSQAVDGVSIPQTAEWYFGSYDIQFHSLNGLTQTAEIFLQSTNGQEIRTVVGRRGRSNQLVGDPVAKMGKTTGVTTGTISSTTSAPAYVPNVNATFMRANDLLIQGGDSGGPVYFGNTAYGVVSGTGGIYMAIDYGENAGYSLVTGK